MAIAISVNEPSSLIQLSISIAEMPPKTPSPNPSNLFTTLKAVSKVVKVFSLLGIAFLPLT